MNKAARIFTIAGILFFGNFSFSQKSDLISSSSTSSNFVITNVSLFDGENQVVQKNRDVFVNNKKIEFVTSNGQKKYEGYEIIDGRDKFLMPGLIDAHVHLQSNGSVPWAKVKLDQQGVLDATLYCGVTTVFDLGGIANKTKKIKESASKGKRLSPNIYNAHIPITIPGAHPIPASKEALPFPLNKMVDGLMPTVSSKEEAQKVIKKYVKEDIDFVKIICDQLPPGTPEMEFETLKWIIDEVHQYNYKAVVHIGSPKNAIDAINAGADVLAHGVVRGILTDEQAKKIAESQIPIVYTLFGFEFTEQLARGVFVPNNYDSLLIPEKLLSGISGKNALRISESEVIHSFACSLTKEKKDWKNNFELLLKYNAKIIVGTDAGAPGYYHGTAIYHEMDELKKYGMNNFQILRAATSSAAGTYIDQPDFGSIKEGFQADLLLLNGNALENLNFVKEPALVISNGIRVVRK